jgi:hypothetical protein
MNCCPQYRLQIRLLIRFRQRQWQLNKIAQALLHMCRSTSRLRHRHRHDMNRRHPRQQQLNTELKVMELVMCCSNSLPQPLCTLKPARLLLVMPLAIYSFGFLPQPVLLS